jgi:chloramphenicol 3-O phosphotransferase
MSKIIFLNGCSSSGKTSIAKNIQQTSQTDWLHLGVDTISSMLPERCWTNTPTHQQNYLNLIPNHNQKGPILDIKTTLKGQATFEVIVEFSKVLANLGNDIIIDEVLLDDSKLFKYAQALQEHTVWFIGIYCSLEILQLREQKRGDRMIGLANSQLEKVHKGIRPYDIWLNTSDTPPEDFARLILTKIQKSRPKSFFSIRSKLKKDYP